MYLVAVRSRLKNRIHATLAKYALRIGDVSDIFGKRARHVLCERIRELPEHTQFATQLQLQQVEQLDGVIGQLNQRMKEVFDETESVRLLRSMPGIGFLLGVVISLEVGDIRRFPGPEQTASYAGTAPRVHASGGKVRYGALRIDMLAACTNGFARGKDTPRLLEPWLGTWRRQPIGY